MKFLIAFLILLLLSLQYMLWLSPHGIHEYLALKHAIKEQQQENQQLSQRNQKLVADIHQLKHGTEAIEEHARNDLGMVKPDETFYQVVPPAKHQ